MSTMRVTLLVAVALVGSLLLPVPAAPAAPAPRGATTRVIADCLHRSVEPRKVILTCADGNTWAVVKSYGSWRARRARGAGRLHVNDCDPSCAGGTFHVYRATFRFHRVVDTSRGPLFTRLGVTYHRGGKAHHALYSLPRHRL